MYDQVLTFSCHFCLALIPSITCLTTFVDIISFPRTKAKYIGTEQLKEERCMAVLVQPLGRRGRRMIQLYLWSLLRKLLLKPQKCHLELVAMLKNFSKTWAGKRYALADKDNDALGFLFQLSLASDYKYKSVLVNILDCTCAISCLL